MSTCRRILPTGLRAVGKHRFDLDCRLGSTGGFRPASGRERWPRNHSLPGVVTTVPHWAMCTGSATTSCTLRYSPAPGYHREWCSPCVQVHRHQVGFAEPHEARRIHAKRHVAVVPAARLLAIHIDGGHGHRAIKIEVNTFAGVRREQAKALRYQPSPRQGSLPVFASPWGDTARRSPNRAADGRGPGRSSKATASAPNRAPCPKRQPALKFSVRLCA